jgi:hypothetical protein
MGGVCITHGAAPFLRSRQLWSYSRTPQNFTESVGSLPCSLVPILSQINPVHTTPILSKIHFNIIELSHIWKRREMHTRFQSENLEGRHHLGGDPRADVTLIETGSEAFDTWLVTVSTVITFHKTRTFSWPVELLLATKNDFALWS